MALTKITKSGLGDNAVESDKINADAIDATKIADDAISEEHLDTTVITGNTELSATAADDDVLLVFDTSAGTLKKIQRSNIALSAPTFSSVSPTSLLSGDGTGNHTIVVTGTKFDASATFILRTDGGTDISMDSVVRNSSTQLTGTVAKNTANLTNANEPFDIIITNGSGLAVTTADQLNVDASPVYVTAAGTLGTVAGGSAISTIDVVAADPESTGNVTFELQSGSLPAGLSSATVNENGVSKFRITGTATNPAANTTSNFTLRAVDAASNTTSRAFSITVTRTFTEQSFTASGTFSVPSGVTVVDVLVVAGGGTGGVQHGGGGGAGGLIFMPEYPVTPGGTVSVTVGDGGGVNPGTQPVPCTQGQDSVFGTLTAQGGGSGSVGGPANPNPYGGRCGGSGGGGGHEGMGAGTGTQPTAPGNSGAYGFGNPGGGSTPGPDSAGGGGGGAGAAGPNQNPGNPGNWGAPGGIGRAYTIADGTTPVYYAGGGGGSSHTSQTGSGGVGGQGGGGNGGVYQGSQQNVVSPQGMNGGLGTANRGGGGGAKGPGYNQQSGADAEGGGKGVVIVRY